MQLLYNIFFFNGVEHNFSELTLMNFTGVIETVVDFLLAFQDKEKRITGFPKLWHSLAIIAVNRWKACELDFRLQVGSTIDSPCLI